MSDNFELELLLELMYVSVCSIGMLNSLYLSCSVAHFSISKLILSKQTHLSTPAWKSLVLPRHIEHFSQRNFIIAYYNAYIGKIKERVL